MTDQPVWRDAAANAPTPQETRCIAYLFTVPARGAAAMKAILASREPLPLAGGPAEPGPGSPAAPTAKERLDFLSAGRSRRSRLEATSTASYDGEHRVAVGPAVVARDALFETLSAAERAGFTPSVGLCRCPVSVERGVETPPLQQFVVTALKGAIIVAVFVLAWRRRKLNGHGLFASLGWAWIIFFILSPGVCAQYLVWLMPFVLALSPRFFAWLTATSSLFLFIGADAHTDWLRRCVELDRKGFVLTGPALSPGAADAEQWRLAARSPFLLETSLPGVFAAGDVRSGSAKRIASAVGEGSMAVSFVHAHIQRPA